MRNTDVSILTDWTCTLLQALEIATGKKELGMGPPMVARALAITYSAAFQAWGTYDPSALPVVAGGHPKINFSLVSVEASVSYAVFRSAVALFPHPEVSALLHSKMKALGYDPLDTDVVGTTASAVGNKAAQLVLADRFDDGANQSGLEPGSPKPPQPPGRPQAYADYTNYKAENAATFIGAATRRSSIKNVARWQPLAYSDPATGQIASPGYIAPHWGRVRPFALNNGSQFRPPAPAEVWTQRFLDQAKHVIEVQRRLTVEQKIIAEYWADGPRSWLPPGHWCEIAGQVSAKRRHDISTDAKMYFAVANAILDASIATWEAKRHFDYCRPVTAIRWLFDGVLIDSWDSASGNIVLRDGALWRPFQKDSFPTPPFAEYTSGHSAFSMAAATVLAKFTGDDRFEITHTQDHPLAAEPSLDVIGHKLTWTSFTAAALSAGESRLFGGIHFYEGNVSGLLLGEKVGKAAWAKAQQYF